MLRTLAFASALALAAPAMAQQPMPDPMHGPMHHPRPPATINIGGTGEVSVAPDMATITIGVGTRAETAAAAVAGNSEAALAIIETLKASGVAAENIQTVNFSVSPVYDEASYQRPEGPRIVAYQATNQVVVEVHELDRLGTVLDAAVASGANRIDGLTFGLEDDSVIADKARAEAVGDARRKAEVLAGAAGVSLGRILSISEGGGGIPIPMYDRSFAMAAEAMAVPIERGQTTVTASVHIVWEIEPGAE